MTARTMHTEQEARRGRQRMPQHRLSTQEVQESGLGLERGNDGLADAEWQVQTHCHARAACGGSAELSGACRLWEGCRYPPQ